MAKPRIPKQKQKKIAQEHVVSTLNMAQEQARKGNQPLANKLVKLTRKIAMKVRLRLNPKLKRQFCKHCYAYQVPNKNRRIRINQGKVSILCKECNKFTRIPITPKRKQNSRKTKKKESKQDTNNKPRKKTSKRQSKK